MIDVSIEDQPLRFFDCLLDFAPPFFGQTDVVTRMSELDIEHHGTLQA